MRLARKLAFDLVEISPKRRAPVVKIMDSGKFKYEDPERESEARKKQKIIRDQRG